MVKIEEMNKNQVEQMLQERCMLAVDLDDFDRKYPDVFCAVTLDVNYVVHVWQAECLRQIAKVLGEELVIRPYSEEEKELYPEYKGEIYFYYEYLGYRWRVHSLYSDESEVVG